MAKSPILLILLLLGHVPSAAQACGYIFAKFDVRNSSGISVSDARLEFLGRDTNSRIVNAKKELAYLPEAGAFRLRHGMCGSHSGAKLVIRHDAYETFESVIDLSLNSPRTEHVFSIVLKRKGSNETPSLERWAALHGIVEDTAGKPLEKIDLTLVGSDGRRYETASESGGVFSFSVRKGKYLLEAAEPGGAEKIRLDLSLEPGPRWESIKMGGSR